MRIRSIAASVLVALALTACGDNATTAPRSVAPAAPHFNLAATNADISTTIDQLFTSPFVRIVAHADWNWIVAQVSKCSTQADVLKLQSFLNQLVTYLQSNAPKGNAAKAALFTHLITDMAAYVNEAVSGVPQV